MMNPFLRLISRSLLFSDTNQSSVSGRSSSLSGRGSSLESGEVSGQSHDGLAMDLCSEGSGAEICEDVGVWLGWGYLICSCIINVTSCQRRS